MIDKITCPTCGGNLIKDDVHSSEDLWSCDVCGHILENGSHWPPYVCPTCNNLQCNCNDGNYFGGY